MRKAQLSHFSPAPGFTTACNWTFVLRKRTSILTCLEPKTKMAPASIHSDTRSPKRRKLEAMGHGLMEKTRVKSDQYPPRPLEKGIELTNVEKRLRRLLLDVVDHTERTSASKEDGSECTIPKSLQDTKLELRFTGGWVRDKLLGIGSQDIDVSINKMTGLQFGLKLKKYLEDKENLKKYASDEDSSETTEQALCGNLHKIAANPEKSKHLETVTVRICGLDIDLVNLRKETYTEQSRNPQMEFGTPEEDALRRDATINAMFYNLSSSQVEDFTQRGLEDMKNHIIRTPLDPYQTFRDDPLRVLRLIRFATRFGYKIDQAAETAMSNPEIQQALMQKITRERVGKELEKMLKGPDPCGALHLIHRTGLYNVIFGDPTGSITYEPDLEVLGMAYNALSMLIHPNDGSKSVRSISRLILIDPEDEYIIWVLCAMVPWADAPIAEAPKKGGKQPPPPAVSVAREGFKATNKVCDILGASIHNFAEIISVKTTFIRQMANPQRKVVNDEDMTTREHLGMAIRRWGSSWKSQMTFALAYDMVHNSSDIESTFDEFAKFVEYLENLQILEAYKLKPIIDGTALSKALSIKPGPWMKPALDVVMQWQLKNPDKTDAVEVIEEIRAKQGELTKSLAHHFLRLTIRPSFAKVQLPSVTSTGRRSINENLARKFTQLEIDDSETRPWKYDGYTLDMLKWIISSLDAQTVEKVWQLLIPPLLVIVDDSSPLIKAEGCKLFSEQLRITSPSLLARTGLGGVIEEAIMPCLMYLPPLTSEEECIPILSAAYPSLLSLATVHHADPSQKSSSSGNKPKFLHKLVRKGIFYGLSHAGENVKVAQVLLDQLRQIVQSLGLESVKHLKTILPTLSGYLTDPLGPAYPPLLKSAVETLQSVILSTWPRVSLHRLQIVKALAVCWVRIADLNNMQDLKDELQKAANMLQTAVMATTAELAEEIRALESEDNTLKGLFSNPESVSTALPTSNLS